MEILRAVWCSSRSVRCINHNCAIVGSFRIWSNGNYGNFYISCHNCNPIWLGSGFDTEKKCYRNRLFDGILLFIDLCGSIVYSFVC